MSAIQLSRSGPVLVAARVVCRTCRIIHCIHSATEAFASSTARMADPTVRSSNCVAAAWTAAAMFCTRDVNVCRESCIIYAPTENERTWV